ncbi:hypothetical protein D3C84_528330 [compost metagenome]
MVSTLAGSLLVDRLLVMPARLKVIVPTDGCDMVVERFASMLVKVSARTSASGLEARSGETFRSSGSASTSDRRPSG